MGSLDLEIVFIGVPKLPAGAAELDAHEQAALQSLLRENSCMAVFLSSQLTKAHFFYSFTVLWPLLHNQVPDQHAGGQSGDGALVSSWWKGYVASNEAFASTVKQSLRAGDMVWVHSHPLLLVPSALRQARWPPGAWHSPQPMVLATRPMNSPEPLCSACAGADPFELYSFILSAHALPLARGLARAAAPHAVAAGPAFLARHWIPPLRVRPSLHDVVSSVARPR